MCPLCKSTKVVLTPDNQVIRCKNCGWNTSTTSKPAQTQNQHEQ